MKHASVLYGPWRKPSRIERLLRWVSYLIGVN